MKKLFLILFVAVIAHNSYAWDWEPYGPDGIKANKLCFFENIEFLAVICMDSGMYVTMGFSGEFEFCTYANMPVIEAVAPGFDTDSLMLVMSDGSWSDGIYSFNSDWQFNVLHYCYRPNFIIYNEVNDDFYVGHEYGLLHSSDGLTWNDVEFFNGKTCLDMEINFGRNIIATDDENNNTYISSDNGSSWTQLVGENITEFTSIQFGYATFYGIRKSESNNGGFYQISEPYSNWELVFPSSHLNTIGMNNVGSPFIGWHSGVTPHEGIAACYPELTFINDGLPNLNIRSISAPLILGATVIYCCTDSRIYSRVLSVAVPEYQSKEVINIYPNPVSSQTTIHINLPEVYESINSISVFNNQGEKVDEIKVKAHSANENSIIWNKGNLPSGIYYLLIKNKNKSWSEKFIIL